MERMPVERRWLLQGGFGVLLGLMSRVALADVLVTDSEAVTGGDGLTAAQLRLGELLIRYLAGHGERGGAASDAANVVVSPASLAAIMSFVDLGASSRMHAAIHRALGFRGAARRRAAKDLQALRQGVSEVIKQSGKDGPLVLANLVAFDRAVRPKQLAMFGLSGAGADVLVDNLADSKVVDRINGWVREKTHDLIPSILEEAPETLGLVAVNALYFKDKWQTPFDPARTAPAPFQTVSGKPADVTMMHSKVGSFRVRFDDRFIAADLGYAHDNFKLVVVTTRSAPARPQDFAAAAGWLDGKGFEERKAEIGMPKLNLSAAGELLPPLDAFGLAPVRLSPNALEAFSDEALPITRIVQKVELRLDEDGTEAAAATAVITTRSIAITPEPIVMTVDKPFVFALRDDNSGLILFMGYVGAPPKS